MTHSVFSNTLTRDISSEEIESYERDGAAVLRGVLDMDWIERMQDAVDRILNNPGNASIEYTPKGKKGRYYGDFFIWRRDEDFRAFTMDSPLPQLAAQVMKATGVQFFYDQLLVKEPHTEEATPWHQDLSYWPVRGEDVLSIWVPFDRVTVDAGAVTYIKGSHKWGKLYAPNTFSDNSGFGEQYKKMGLEALPDVAANLDQYDLLQSELEMGDVLIHHPLTLHYAPGNLTDGRRRGLSLRYLGDDAVYDSRPGTFVENPKVKLLIPEADFANDFSDGNRLGGEIFPQVWPR
ncbi:MAG: phytanoyl-CoA dioxygenase family protein [Fimbriimonadaceae bacterium]|nr:phytanoyl-CoA dioxygenase family protein [Alphaproteobacteria bacterium]